jgi:hypothetical protein
MANARSSTAQTVAAADRRWRAFAKRRLHLRNDARAMRFNMSTSFYIGPLLACACATNPETYMDILKLAQESGMLVVLDARIGNAEYHSVHGSVSSLVNFARAIIEQRVRCEDLPAPPGSRDVKDCAPTEDTVS